MLNTDKYCLVQNMFNLILFFKKKKINTSFYIEKIRHYLAHSPTFPKHLILSKVNYPEGLLMFSFN